MSKSKFFISMIFAVAAIAWSSGDALAQGRGQGRGPKPEAGKPVTRDDVAKYMGRVTPSEHKAAQIRARRLGIKPGIAGLAAQAPVAPPAAQAPKPGKAR